VVPVEYDGVAKTAVMNPDKDDGSTLRDAMLTASKEQTAPRTWTARR
jgi:hypothetical protein